MNTTQLVIALIIGLAALMLMVMKTKIHAALALVLSAVLVGLAGGIEIGKIAGLITGGFGSTLSSIGLVIAFGCMMGQIMEESNAARVMAHTMIKAMKGKNEDLALAITGFLVSIPIFCDSGFVILSPLVKSISQAKKKSLTGLGCALGMALCITHATCPPTPGPLAAVAQYGDSINLGIYILFSLIMGIPLIVAALIISRIVGQRWYKVVDENGEIVDVSPEQAKEYAKLSNVPTIPQLDPNEKYPSVLKAFAPIVVPVILILMSTVTSMVYKGEPTFITEIISLIGSPVIALSISLIVAIYTLAGNKNRKEIADCMERGISSCGSIILITGAGGAFGNIIKSSGIGDVLAQSLSNSSLPIVLLPFVMAGLLKFVLGSGTVSMTVTATTLAPILMQVPGANMMLCCYAGCIGSQMFSLPNDSYYWVVTRILKLEKVDEQIFGWCGTVFLTSWFALIPILIASFVL